MNKDLLRKEILAKLSFLSTQEIQNLNHQLTLQLIKFLNNYPDFTRQTGAFYFPMKKEAAPFYEEIKELLSKKLAFPVLIEGKMQFGIPSNEPQGMIWLELPFELIEPNWIVVPGVGFDLKGNRLGRGKGFYDQYLANFKGKKVGIAWDKQIIEKVPTEQHDCQMDFIITENFCWDVSRQMSF